MSCTNYVYLQLLSFLSFYSFFTVQERETILFLDIIVLYIRTIFLGTVVISKSSQVFYSDSMINVTGPLEVLDKITLLFVAEILVRPR
jgi:hypothetical protein